MKILIVGSVGSGKTTFAKKLSKEINIKYYEMDSIVHDDINKRKRSIKERKEIVNKINKQESWIIEGVLNNKITFIFDYADKIIFLDIPKRVRIFRIIKRFIKQRIGIEKCNYKVNFQILKDMFKWTKKFEDNKKSFENIFLNYKDKVIILKKTNKYTLRNLCQKLTVKY